jgi:hypothetical protein
VSTAALIRQLAEAGIRLTPNGERLRVEAKPGAVTAELRALIANRKDDLLAELDHVQHGTREARQAKVEAALRDRPELRVAFDVIDAPLKGSCVELVSVVLAVRHQETILSGELHIPAERWDMRAFLAVVDCGSEQTQ